MHFSPISQMCIRDSLLVNSLTEQIDGDIMILSLIHIYVTAIKQLKFASKDDSLMVRQIAEFAIKEIDQRRNL